MFCIDNIGKKRISAHCENAKAKSIALKARAGLELAPKQETAVAVIKPLPNPARNLNHNVYS